MLEILTLSAFLKLLRLAEKWQYLSIFFPSGVGYMFSRDAGLKRHNGSSLGVCMSYCMYLQRPGRLQ